MQNSFLIWLSEKAKGLDFTSTLELLGKLGWKLLDCSCSESIVLEKKNVPFVIKVTHSIFFDVEHFRRKVTLSKDAIKDKAFAETLFFDCGEFFLVAQEKVKVLTWENKIRRGFERKIKEIYAKYSFTDIRHGNIGIINGQLKIFDWLAS